MAFSDNLLSLETRFQLNNTPENFKITDDTDWVGQGIALADVEGVLTIKDPNGNTIHSTVLPAVDIDLDVQDYIDTIVLPKDSNGVVYRGTYTIIYTAEVTGGVDPGIYTKTFLYDFCYEDIDVDVDLTVDLICSKLTSTDNTSYPSEVTNTTRTHTVHPPAGLNAVTYPVQTVSTQTNIYTPITTKTWTGKVVNILELTYTDGLIVDVTVTGNSERDIQDDINICNLQCNMRALVSRYNTALTNNTANADIIYREQLAPALVNAFMYTSNIECGSFDKATTYYDAVLQFTGSQLDCQCSDSDTPTLIQASCSGGGSGQTYVVDACGTNNAITVSSNTIGDTTTYTICFNQTLFNKLSALTETTVTSTDNSITVTPSTSGTYSKNYDLSINLGTPSASPVHSFSGLLEIDLTNKSAVPSLSWSANWSTLVGDKLQEPSMVNTQTLFADYQVSPNCFYFETYVDQAGGEYPKPQMQIVDVLDSVGAGNGCNDLRNFQVVISKMDTANDRIYFKLMNQDGFPISGAELTELYDTILISVIINA